MAAGLGAGRPGGVWSLFRLHSAILGRLVPQQAAQPSVRFVLLALLAGVRSLAERARRFQGGIVKATAELHPGHLRFERWEALVRVSCKRVPWSMIQRA